MNNVNLSRGIVESLRWCLCSVDIDKQQGVATVVPQLSPDGGGPPFSPRTALQRVLVGDKITILKNDGVRQWVSDDIPYISIYKMENKIHLWNHQPGYQLPSFIHQSRKPNLWTPKIARDFPPSKATVPYGLENSTLHLGIQGFTGFTGFEQGKVQQFPQGFSEYPQTQVVPQWAKSR